jgi:hypothetical protein
MLLIWIEDKMCFKRVARVTFHDLSSIQMSRRRSHGVWPSFISVCHLQGVELSTSFAEIFLSANFCRIVESLFVLHKSLLALKWVQIT